MSRRACLMPAPEALVFHAWPEGGLSLGRPDTLAADRTACLARQRRRAESRPRTRGRLISRQPACLSWRETGLSPASSKACLPPKAPGLGRTRTQASARSSGANHRRRLERRAGRPCSTHRVVALCDRPAPSLNRTHLSAGIAGLRPRSRARPFETDLGDKPFDANGSWRHHASLRRAPRRSMATERMKCRSISSC